jgi:LCP family protein required for cell wall assembly
VADLSTSSQPQTNSDEAYMAVRIDEAAHQLTFISVPSTISVKLSDGQNHLLSEAESVGGDAELISAISSLLGVDISHFAKTDSAGLSRLVELVGGVPVQITSEIDDSTAGTAVIQPGEVTLSPNQALTLLRASNYSDPYETQAKLRAAFTVNLAERAVAGESLSFASLISDGAEGVSTDWTSSQILSLAEVVKPADSVVLYASVVPGREVTSDDGQTTYEITSNELTSMMEAINAGDAPESADESTASVDRSAVTVEVRNGSGITGAAKRCGELLEGFGYQVSKVGNTDDGTTYKETLVIYKDEAYEVAARAIVKDMDAGRVVDGGDFYTFSTNVLVIVGTDWMG